MSNNLIKYHNINNNNQNLNHYNKENHYMKNNKNK